MAKKEVGAGLALHDNFLELKGLPDRLNGFRDFTSEKTCFRNDLPSIRGQP